MVDVVTERIDGRQAQITALAVGDSFALTKRITFDQLSEQTVIDTIERLRGTVATAVNRVKHQTGRDFVVESGSFAAARSPAMFVSVIVTRLS